MKKLNLHEVKTHLSRYLPLLKKGETILLCKQNVPIAEIRPFASLHKAKRPIGLAKGEFSVSPEFLEPLPDEHLLPFLGEEQ
ncbi:MAG: type II toxin-antitoxin system Phd/YefM family antitoxin [Deltaproteobacteria bacterium]|nr:type II toxin-antitoxin system Phd/YefM family antitoxin [Deltaproteobacteria bacterium]